MVTGRYLSEIRFLKWLSHRDIETDECDHPYGTSTFTFIPRDIEKKKIALQEQEIKDKRENDKKLVDLKEKELEVELYQLHDGNPYNDRIRNS